MWYNVLDCANLFIVVFLSALMLIERDRARGYLLNFVDEQDREAVTDTGRRALLKLGAYVRGQLLVMTIIGGAIGTPLMGLIAEQTHSTALSYLVPLLGYVVVGGYSLYMTRYTRQRIAATSFDI